MHGFHFTPAVLAKYTAKQQPPAEEERINFVGNFTLC